MSYRARLTPKPWRCGLRAADEQWPFSDPRAENAFRKWQEEDGRRQSGYAACRLLLAMGNPSVA